MTTSPDSEHPAESEAPETPSVSPTHDAAEHAAAAVPPADAMPNPAAVPSPDAMPNTGALPATNVVPSSDTAASPSSATGQAGAQYEAPRYERPASAFNAQQTQPTQQLPNYYQAPHAAQQSAQAATQAGQTTAHPTQAATQPAQAPGHAVHSGAQLHATQPAYMGATPAPAQTSSSSKGGSSGRGGTMVAGIAIGALLGALVGGGTAALVGSNLQGESTSNVASPAGTITLNSTDNVSTISAVAAIATPSVVTIEVTGTQAAGSGSGVIYTEDGYIITNSHVATLEGAAGSNAVIRVRLSDGRVLDGELVGADPYADIAVIKIDADNLTPITIGDSEAINVGDMTVVIGAPLNLPNTVTSGVVSALNRGISVGTASLPDNGSGSDDNSNGDGNTNDGSPWGFDFEGPNSDQSQQSTTATANVTLPVIQTDASINPGNSGGALLNADAELIGINVAIASNGDASSAGSDGLGFAIPVSYATRVADALIAGEQPSHGLFGASVGNSSQDTDEDANRAGALLMDLTPGGAAEKAGFKVGDVVTAIDGIPVDSGTSISALVRMLEGGSTVTMTYTRGGVLAEAEVTLDTLSW